MTISARTILIIFSLCLVSGGTTHVIDIWQGGLFPYHGVPCPINFFWTSLAILDFTAVLLLWKRQNLGLLLTTGIMLADVTINSYATYGLGIVFQSFAPLQAQTLFLGFVLGAFTIVWNRGEGERTQIAKWNVASVNDVRSQPSVPADAFGAAEQ